MVRRRFRKRISDEIRLSVLRAAQEPGCVVSELARSRGISAWTIRKWVKEEGNFKESKDGEISRGSNFVELLVAEPSNSIQESVSILEKASFTFSNCSVSIEGKIKVEKLIEIIKVLDTSC